MPHRSRLVGRVVVAGLLLAACAKDNPTAAPSTTTSTTVAGTTTSAGPTTTTTTIAKATPPVTGPARVVPAPAQAAAAACPAVPARAEPRTDRPTYKLNVDVRPADNIVVGSQRVEFTPDKDTDKIVFRLWANAPRIARAGGKIEVGVDGAKSTQPDATTLVIPRNLKAGESTTVDLNWQITLPTSSTNDRISHTGSAIRLGSFFPVLAWHPGLGQWATEPATSGFAESSISLPSDFDVTLTVPQELQAFATGVNDKPGHWVASGVADWAVSIGDLKVVTATADGGGGEVKVTVAADRQIGDAPGPYLDKIVKVITDFGKRFGPYPWPTYSMVLTPELSGGIEYPMHVMQGPGTLGRTTSHEIGHQWFYGLVPTNQGATPWIDEGLATYAESRFEGTLQKFKTTAIPADGRGKAGEPMTYWESRQSIYYRSVYVQGAQAVAALGPPDQVDCGLRQLVARQAYQLTGNGEMVAALTTVFPNAAEVLGRYGIKP
jgi:hypothetical protein